MADKTDGVLAVLALVNAAAPGPWEADTTKCDGDFGSGEETRTGYMAHQMTDANGLAIFDSLNADSRAVLIDVDDGDESDYAWDVLAERNFKAAAAAVNFVRSHGAAVAELLAAAERNLANIDLINPPDGPFWSGANDQEALREAIRAMRGEPPVG